VVSHCPADMHVPRVTASFHEADGWYSLPEVPYSDFLGNGLRHFSTLVPRTQLLRCDLLLTTITIIQGVSHSITVFVHRATSG